MMRLMDQFLGVREPGRIACCSRGVSFETVEIDIPLVSVQMSGAE